MDCLSTFLHLLMLCCLVTSGYLLEGYLIAKDHRVCFALKVKANKVGCGLSGDLTDGPGGIIGQV